MQYYYLTRSIDLVAVYKKKITPLVVFGWLLAKNPWMVVFFKIVVPQNSFKIYLEAVTHNLMYSEYTIAT